MPRRRVSQSGHRGKLLRHNLHSARGPGRTSGKARRSKKDVQNGNRSNKSIQIPGWKFEKSHKVSVSQLLCATVGECFREGRAPVARLNLNGSLYGESVDAMGWARGSICVPLRWFIWRDWPTVKINLFRTLILDLNNLGQLWSECKSIFSHTMITNWQLYNCTNLQCCNDTIISLLTVKKKI